MAGRSTKGRGGGRVNNNNNTGGRGGRGGVRSKTTKVGLNKELEGNIFDLGERSSADLMRTTQIKISQYVGSQYGGDIMSELETKKEFVAPPPVYPATATARQPDYETMIRAQQNNTLMKLQRRRERLLTAINTAPPLPADPEQLEKLEDQLFEVNNEILQLEFDMGVPIKVPLNDEEKGEWRIQEKAYGERVQKHTLNQQKAFAIIIGQCTQRLQDKLHDDSQWDAVNKAQKPLELYALIERVVMKQTGDEYPPCNLVDHLLAVLTMKQQPNMSNAQWYEKFNTRVDVAESVGVQFDQFRCLWECCTEARGWTDYDSLSPAEQSTIRSDSKDRLLAYLIIKNSKSNSTHDTVRNNLLEAYIAKRDEYPTTRSNAISLLNKYDEKKTVQNVPSEGTAFAQKGKKGDTANKEKGKNNDNKEEEEKKKNFFENKECYLCGKKGHGVKKCPEKFKKEKSDDSSSISSKSEKRLEDFEKRLKSTNKQFAQLKSQIEDEESESSSDKQSNFQFMNVSTLSNKEEQKIDYEDLLFKQSSRKLDGLDLRQVILLDNQSTMSLFCNKRMVTNIRNSDQPLTLQSNGGSMVVNKIASIGEDQPPVWFSTKAITNILSLKDAIMKYWVTYDSHDREFVVYRGAMGLSNMRFKMHSSGLHFYDPRNKDFSFVTTVEDNKKHFTNRQITGAQKARDLLASLAYPSEKDFKWILQANQIKDCPVSLEDAQVATKIWGKNVAALKGKTVRKTPAHVATDIIAVPTEIQDLHRYITISIDVFFVNKIPFLITLSRKICFTTVTHLTNRKIETIFNAFRGIFKYYLQRGFQIMTVTADGEFSPMENFLLDLPGAPRLNLAAANEHEPFVERKIRLIKERTRAVRHSLPFTALPMQMTTHMVFFVVKLLNYFPVKGGISEQYSPKAIMSGEVIQFKQYCLPFGTYCQIHEEDGPRNSLVARTQGAISLGPSKNVQGGQHFYTLNSAKVVVRRSWDVLPMPQAVINRVNTLAADQPQLLTFYDRQKREIGDTDDVPDSPEPTDHYEMPGVIGGVVQIPGVDTAETPTDDTKDLVEGSESNQNIIPSQATEHDPTLIEQPPAVFDFEPSTPPEKDTQPDASTPTTNVEAINPPVIAQQTPRRSARTRKQTQFYEPSMKGKTYGYSAAQTEAQDHEYPPQVVELILTQMTLKSAMKTWGKAATMAAEAEMKQLHWRNSFRPVRWNKLSSEQKAMVLESHIFLTQKRTGEIKGRTVAGGNKQRNYIEKEDASSPTVATESVILTSIVDAVEERETAVVDIPNAFIQTVVKDEKKRVIIRIRGMLVDMLVKIAPDVYKDYVTTNKRGEKQLLVECLNALYGTMVASLLYYQKFTTTLSENGYMMNPYDACVWNKTIDKHQCTICFHVDDCKISHVSKNVVDDVIEWLRKDYESVFEDGSGKMKVHRGKTHTYLGMTLDFSVKKQIRISMTGYVKEIVAAWDNASPRIDDQGFKTVRSKRGRKGRISAAPENLFKVDEDAEKLTPVQATAFHNIVAKALYLVKRARPDASLAIAFLSTRVREPDVDDWAKLEHLIEYFRSTEDLPLILGADGTGVLNWYVDASFAVHANMRGHTGGALTMGRGFPIVSSTKQKLNTRSSTESELVGVDDMMPSVLWTRYFLKAQGYKISDNIIFQDNKSTMLLERNGKASSSKRTKHINVRYFFITDRISKGEVRVEWCPTDKMVADYLTKPLQGSKFKKFRDLIMGALPKNEEYKVLVRDGILETHRQKMAHK